LDLLLYLGLAQRAGTSATAKCGEWSVDVLVADANGVFQKQYTDNFTIIENPAVAPACDVTQSPAQAMETQAINLDATATDNTYLKSVALYWNDGVLQSKTWDNVFSNAFDQTLSLGGYPAGQQLEYWVVATDTSGNTHEGLHHTAIVQSETVSSPLTPSGTNTASWRQVVQFSTSGSTTTLGEAVEYQFDWGDGQQSDYGSATQSHSWGAGGTFAIRARARSQLRTGRVSNWSGNALLSVPAPVVPRLGIQLISGQVKLFWPTNPPGFVLQTSKSIATNSAWSTLVTGPTLVGGQYVLTQTPVGSNSFYRLTSQ
jgi:hypothetical protein